MNIYNRFDDSHNIFIILWGNIPNTIVGIININISNLSLFVQSDVNEIYGVFTPPVNLFVNFIWYDADNNTDNAAKLPNIGELFIAPDNDNNSPMKFIDNGVPTLQKLNIIKYIDNNGIYVIKPW